MRHRKLAVAVGVVLFGTLLLVMSAEAHHRDRPGDRRTYVNSRHNMDRLERNRARQIERLAQREARREARMRARELYGPFAGSLAEPEFAATATRTPSATRSPYVPRIPFIPSLESE